MEHSIGYQWTLLPAEIRLLVLDCLLSIIKNRSDSVASYAAVCFEWQHFFESFSFRLLRLDNFSLPVFDEAIRGKNASRLSLIRNLELCVLLIEYDCPDCWKRESPNRISLNNDLFTIALKQLFMILSRWKPGRGHVGGLTLELNAYSPSDTHHYHHYRGWHYSDLHRQFHLKEHLPQSLDAVNPLRQKVADIKAATITHRRIGIAGAFHRLGGTPLHIDSADCLPNLPIVCALWIRPQFYRGIEFRSLAKMFRESLTSVTCFWFERWAATAFHEVTSFRDFENYLVPALPLSLVRFSFNQWSRSGIFRTSVFGDMKLSDCETSPMAALSNDLVEFCPHWQFFPWQFFIEMNGPCGFQHPETESKLERLCLEHREVYLPDISSQEVNQILVVAALAAMKLANLKTLETWSAAPGYGYIFRYELSINQATITWRSLGAGVTLEGEVIEQWTEVAAKHDVALLVNVDPFVKSTKDGMVLDGKIMYRHLILCNLAIDPVTLALLESEVV